jgi:transposase
MHMVVVGVDAHKRTHTLVAVDEAGRKLGERTVAATPDGHLDAVAWVGRWPEHVFALEDCRHLTRRFERDLLVAGEPAVRVPTRLMAEARHGGRDRGKSDPIDALAVARAALREPDLPVVQLDGEARELRLLVDHRDDLVKERTQVQSRLRWHLHELFPGLEIAPKALRRFHVMTEVEHRLEGVSGTVARIARELLVRCRELTVRANELEREITVLVRRQAPSLLTLPGCGVLSAAKIVGESAGATRFRSRAAYARWNGTAPVPAWSGNPNRHRLTRGGNRQINAALHRIAITQLRGVGTIGREYVEHRMSKGDTKTEALRMLRRRLSDEVFRRLLADEVAHNTGATEQFRVAA